MDEINRMQGMTEADILARKGRIKAKKLEHVEIWKARLEQWQNEPGNTPPDDLIGYFNSLVFAERAQREDFGTLLNPQEKLGILDQLDVWYSEKGLAFPNPSWLERQRTKYKTQLSSDTASPMVFPSES